MCVYIIALYRLQEDLKRSYDDLFTCLTSRLLHHWSLVKETMEKGDGWEGDREEGLEERNRG